MEGNERNNNHQQYYGQRYPPQQQYQQPQQPYSYGSNNVTGSSYSSSYAGSSRNPNVYHQPPPPPNLPTMQFQQAGYYGGGGWIAGGNTVGGAGAGAGGTYTAGARSSGGYHPSSSNHANPNSRIPAPVTVEEALQYTPLSSIVPFHEHIIPLPSIDTSAFAAKADRRGVQMLGDLNAMDPSSKKFRQTTREVAEHIVQAGQKSGIGNLTFKTNPSRPSTQSQVSIDDLMRSSKIGFMEGTVLNKVSQKVNDQLPQTPSYPQIQAPSDTHYIPPSIPPATQSRTHVSSQQQIYGTPSQAPQTPIRSLPSTSNFYISVPPVSSIKKPHSYPAQTNGYAQPTQRDYSPNSYPTVTSPQPKPALPRTPTQPPENFEMLDPNYTSNGKVLQAVMIPPPKDGFSPAAYSTHEDVDTTVILSNRFKARKRRKIAEDGDDREALISGVDARAKANHAVNSLQTLLISIFEAEDNLQPDTSGRIAVPSSSIWIPVGAVGGPTESMGSCLSINVQTKIESALQRVISCERFGTVDVDELVRLEKICDNTLKMAENLDIKLSETPAAMEEGDGSWDRWIANIGFADNSLKTCKTVLRIMCGGRPEKQLYSEDLLNSIHAILKNLIEGSIDHLVQLRSSSSEGFKAASNQKKTYVSILHEVISIFHLLSSLLSTQEVTEDFLIKLVFSSVSLVFIENATSDKDSVFGVQRVERLRVAAMDVLAKIFARYPDQGNFIINEVLTNLERLPVGRQNARNYKLAEGGNIQLISALIMTLIQSSGTYQASSSISNAANLEESPDENGWTNGGSQASQRVPTAGLEKDPQTAVYGLEDLSQKFLESAQRNASYVVNYIVTKALAASKTGEANSRNLLDLMIEDFILVLGSVDWPGAEIMLKTICNRMIHIVDDHKSPVPAKGTALELLGTMGAAISDVSMHLKEMHRNRETSGSLDSMLSRYSEDYLAAYHDTSGRDRYAIKDEKDATLRKMISWKGPFKVISEHLWEKESGASDVSLRSAWGFFASIWAVRLVNGFRETVETNASEAADIAAVAYNLSKIITEKAWYDEEDEVDTYRRAAPTATQLRQCYTLVILVSDFCNYNTFIIDRLINSIDSDQITTRNKGLKALMHLMNKDPSILESKGLIESMITRCKDQSPQVRDSALDIIGKCLSLKPDLETRVLPTINIRSQDTNAPIRRRAIKILKDIYLGSKKTEVKVEIVKYLLARVNDHETSVAELTRKTFEELWVNPSFSSLKDSSSDDAGSGYKGKMIIKERVGVITKVVVQNEKATDVPLSSLIQYLLDAENKQLSSNIKVCKMMVQALFDDLIELVSDGDKVHRQSIMKTLVVFARASASLFRVDQLETLRPYIKDLSSADDMAIYRSAIVIFRCVLPQLSSAHSKFLEDVAAALLSNVSKLPMTELQEAIYCLSAVNTSYDISAKLIGVSCSCLINLKPFIGVDTQTLQPQIQRKVSRLICIVGLFGRYCDLDKYAKELRAKLAGKVNITTENISEFIVSTILGFTSETTEPQIRKAALEAIGHISKTHPAEFVKEPILQLWHSVFNSDQKEFKLLVLKAFYEFLSGEEKLSEDALAKGKGPAASKDSLAVDYDPDRLTGASALSSRDGVCSCLAQNFLKYILDIAINSLDEYAYAAVEVIGTILRQGLVHPKMCAATLIALETSPDVRFQQIAFREHKAISQKHESLVERAYTEGIRMAFNYQLEIVESEDGADPATFESKLGNLYNLTITSRKVKRKLLSNMVSSLEFDPSRLNINATPKESHLAFTRFVLQNLAYFEYAAVEDVKQVIAELEKRVSDIGTTVVHQIETEILQIRLENDEPKPVDPILKKRLCAASVILTLCWNTRTFLKKYYGISNESALKKKNSKDLTKPPTKVSGMSGRSLWDEMTEVLESLKTDEGMDSQFREFVELLTVDKEFKLLAENEDDELFGDGGAGGGGDYGSDDDGDTINGTTPRKAGRPKKRKNALSPEIRGVKRRKSQGKKDTPTPTPGLDDDDDEED